MLVTFKSPVCIKYRRSLYMTWDGFFGIHTFFLNVSQSPLNLCFLLAFFPYSFIRGNLWLMFGWVGHQFGGTGLFWHRSYFRSHANDQFNEVANTAESHSNEKESLIYSQPHSMWSNAIRTTQRVSPLSQMQSIILENNMKLVINSILKIPNIPNTVFIHFALRQT